MKLRFYSLFAATALMTGLWGCAHEHASEHDHEHDHGMEASGHQEESESDGEINLSPERAEVLGVKTRPAAKQLMAPTVKVTGTVVADASSQAVVVAPSDGLVSFAPGITEGVSVRAGQRIASVTDKGMTGGDPNRSAEIALQAAKAELDRLTPLREAGIVTVKEYNDAKQAYEEALNARGDNSGVAISPISGVITEILVPSGTHADHGTPLAKVSAAGAVKVRADVPVRESAAVRGAKAAYISSPQLQVPVEAAVASSQGAVASGGYVPVYLSVPVAAAASLPAGSYVDVDIVTAGAQQEQLTVPVGAITEKMGKKFVYVRLDEDCYEARPVTLGSDNGIDVVVTEGLAEGEDVVTEGVIYVKLAEQSGASIPPHSHEH